MNYTDKVEAKLTTTAEAGEKVTEEKERQHLVDNAEDGFTLASSVKEEVTLGGTSEHPSDPDEAGK